jgi:cytochrome c-type biogenesis protein CcmH
MVSRLEQRLAANPNDATGWARLGRAYSVMERREDALTAFDRAEKLAPEDREILAEYAWTLFSANPANTEGRVYDLYSRLLRLDPNNPDALWFMGLASHQRGNPRDALRLWTRLAQVLPKDDPAQAELAKVIERTRAEMNERRI